MRPELPKLPSYVACIRRGGTDRRQDNRACGRDGWGFFQSVDHVRNSRQFGSNLVGCPDCLRALGQPELAAAEAALIDMADVAEDPEDPDDYAGFQPV